MQEPVLFEIENGVALITLNRPEKRNAINALMLQNLCKYVEEITSNKNIKVAILTGKDPAFCAGLDFSAIGTGNTVTMQGEGLDYGKAISACNKPMIGAINGHTVTGGFEFALNCDFLIASEKATFRDTHAKLGIHPALGMSQFLQQAIGQRRAKQMSFTGQPISAQKALEWGLVNEVVPHEQLLPRAKAIAADICAVNYDMLLVMKDLIDFKDRATLDEAYARERKSFWKFMENMGSIQPPTST